MRIESIEHEHLVDERRALAEASANVFATPEFHETWWTHFGRGKELRLYGVFDGDRLAGVVPAYVWLRHPVRLIRFLGHGGGDDLGPVAAPVDRLHVAKAMGRVLRDATVIDHAAPEWARLLVGRPVVTEHSPVLLVSKYPGWDAYLATRTSNFRQTIRNRERRLARAHDVVYRLSDERTIARDLDILFRLHRERWGDAATTFGQREAFHRDFARLALSRDWARLVVLEVDGSPAAAWYGFRFGGVDSYYQSGRAAGYSRQSVGLVLLSHTIRTSFEAEQQQYRFLRGGEPYKFRFTEDDHIVQTVICGAGAYPISRAALLASRARRAVS